MTPKRSRAACFNLPEESINTKLEHDKAVIRNLQSKLSKKQPGNLLKPFKLGETAKAGPEAAAVQAKPTGTENGDMIGFLLSGSAGRANATAEVPDYETFEDRYKTAKSPWVISQAFGGRIEDRTDLKNDGIFNLFRLHALDDGEIGHKQFRVLIENILAADNDDSYGQFDLVLESLESDPIKGDKLAVFRNLSLDPESRNYIAKVIGDRHMYYDFDREEGKQRLEERGLFEVRNPFVRVELSEDLELQNGVVPKRAIPAGFRG